MLLNPFCHFLTFHEVFPGRVEMSQILERRLIKEIEGPCNRCTMRGDSCLLGSMSRPSFLVGDVLIRHPDLVGLAGNSGTEGVPSQMQRHPHFQPASGLRILPQSSLLLMHQRCTKKKLP